MSRELSAVAGEMAMASIQTALRWLVLVLTLQVGTALGDDLVRFRSVGTAAERPLEIDGYLSRPIGAGRFPAVVVLHSCLGLPSNRGAIGAKLAEWGYVTLFVDDFATRGLTQTCLVDFPQGLADAYGALGFVASLPFVDPGRIGAVGYSQGGDTALKLAVPRLAATFAQPKGAAFRAVAAYYPPCGNLGRTRLALPALILLGADDTVTPAVACATLAKRQSGVTLTVFPGVEHVFDDPAFAGGRDVFGMHLQYDRAAHDQAAAALRTFLDASLRSR